MKLTKDGLEKHIVNPEVIDRLKREGWKAESAKNADQETGDNEDGGNFDRAEALKKLKEKGVSVHHATGIDKLKALLVEHGIEL